MLISVPQYIDVEDKIVGPITAKQLGWLMLMGISLLIMWKTMPAMGFLLIGVPWGILCLALAFLKPYGQTMTSFVTYGIIFFFKPKIYIWKRTAEKMPELPHVKVENTVVNTEKHLTGDQVHDLARLLDSNGMQRSESVVELLKKK